MQSTRSPGPPVLLAALLFAACSQDPPDAPDGWTDTGLNIIYITLDGVRWQEFFRGTDPAGPTPSAQLMPKFWQHLAPKGTVYGDPLRGGRAIVSNPINVSQPAYASMFVGHVTDCLTNTCPRTTEETVLDRIRRETTLTKKEIATFASWDRIGLVVTKDPDACCEVNAGTLDYDDGTNDPEFARINGLMRTEALPPWTSLKDGELPTDGIRWDRHTFALARYYIEKHRPRFLYLSFVDTDEYGHWEEFANYENRIRDTDGWIDELRVLVDSLGDYGANTVFVITTDHGRGAFHQWGWHGPFWPTSRDIWMYVQHPPAAKGFTALDPTTTEAQHRDLRPTFETLLGLTPSTCADCGRSLLTRAP